MEKWIKQIKNYGPLDVFKLLVWNKNDLELNREVSYEEGLNFANAYNMPFLEVSAKTGNNIMECFIFVALELKARTPNL